MGITQYQQGLNSERNSGDLIERETMRFFPFDLQREEIKGLVLRLLETLDEQKEIIIPTSTHQIDERKSTIHPYDSIVMRNTDSLSTTYYPELQMVINSMHNTPIPCFSEKLLDDFLLSNLLVSIMCEHIPIHHNVIASSREGTFNLGGDLRYFLELLESKDMRGIQRYAYKCIEVFLQMQEIGHQKGIESISVVQGDALGGGFEAALSTNTMIVEETSSFCFPEKLFGTFPGMGLECEGSFFVLGE